MTNYSSRIAEPSSEVAGQVVRVRDRLTAQLGRFGRQFTDLGEREPTEPVNEEVLGLARFIADSIDLNRARFVIVRRAESSDDQLDDLSDVVEYKHSQRYDDDRRSAPDHGGPLSVLSISSSNHDSGYDGDKGDNLGPPFYCNLGVYELTSGLRVIQAVPYRWEGPSGVSETTIMQNTLGELFGTTMPPSYRKQLEGLARINLGVMHPDGQVKPLRPHNPKAFGGDLMPVLDKITRPEAPTAINMMLYDGHVTDFHASHLDIEAAENVAESAAS